MLLLALDTCDSRGSVAVLHDAQTLHSISHDTSEDYSSWLLPAVHAVLQTAGTALPDVDAYAVATGPGSFTGVRVGLTTVKAWSEVYARPIVGVSRLEAMATEASGDSPYVAAFTDAHRTQVFGAMYRRDAGQLQRIDEESVIAPEKFLASVVEIAGDSRVDWISTDPNCITQTQAWSLRQAAGETVQAASLTLAPAIGQLGFHRVIEKRLTDALTLDANYVRRSDAEIFWKGGPNVR